MSEKVDVIPICNELKEFAELLNPECNFDMKTAICLLQYRLVQKIETALGFKLHAWQKQYLFTDDNIPTDIQKERNNGKTTITIIKDILSRISNEVIYLTPSYSIRPKQRYYRNIFLNIYDRLTYGGFKLPKIEYKR